MRISVVIPTLNEAEQIADTIASIPADPGVEILVADGGSRDDTRARAEGAGARVLDAPRGRGPQMNAGAAEAVGDVLVFLHADTRLPPDAFVLIRRVLQFPEVVGGAFRFSSDGRGFFYRFSTAGINLRTAVLRLPFGDQAIFVRAHTFDELGGYRDMPACEDLDFVRRLRGRGRLAVLPARITTSSRKWETHGKWKVYFHHIRTFFQYYLGRIPGHNE